MDGCNFNQALFRAALALEDQRLPSQWPVSIVRDVYGRLRFAIDAWRPLAADEQAEGPRIDARPEEIYPKVIIAGFGRFGQIVGRILRARHIARGRASDRMAAPKATAAATLFSWINRVSSCGVTAR